MVRPLPVLLLGHRYLGMATGALMVMWCLSGMVMVFVPYPSLSEERRESGLAPISWTGGRAFEAGAWPENQSWAGWRIEMLAGRPVLRSQVGRPLDLLTGSAIEGFGVNQAREVAFTLAIRCASARHASALPPPRLIDVVRDDAWTVSSVSAAERPLYRFALDDGEGTEVYVSSMSGKAVQLTTERQRFWSWFGAIPHWLYLAQLRRHPRSWSAVVVYASLGGCFLAGTGIALGWQQVRRIRAYGSARGSVRLWHHAAGLVFGVFALTWVASGLLSMNPWGLLEGSGAWAERLRLAGPPPDRERVRAALASLANAPLASGAVTVASAPLAGRDYFIVETATGQRFRLDEAGRAAPLTSADLARAAMQLGFGSRVASLDLMTSEDAYFVGHAGEQPRLPVYRVILDDEESTRYYLDPVSAEIEEKMDRNSRTYRWLHQGLHCLNVLPAIRGRPAWDVLMLVLLSGVLGVCVTGTYLGLGRLIGSPRRGRSTPTRP
jgi:uncharacterized iron-regulated membrane protein